jgi:hypothetical protein
VAGFTAHATAVTRRRAARVFERVLIVCSSASESVHAPEPRCRHLGLASRVAKTDMRRQAIWFALLSLTTACGGGQTTPGDEPIDREVFIETYVDLRVAAAQAGDFVVPTEEREEILARHGVTAESLLRFADVHGRDVEFMNEVWAEVERRLAERQPSEDSA